jgi:hypothetical protein
VRVSLDTLRSSVPGKRFVWFRDGARLSKSQRTIAISDTGTYQVEAVNQEGCFSPRSEGKRISQIDTTDEVGVSGTQQQGFKVYPNPAQAQITIAVEPQMGQNLRLQLVSITGKVVKQQAVAHGKQRLNLNLSNTASGVYHLKITGKSTAAVRKVIIR